MSKFIKFFHMNIYCNSVINVHVKEHLLHIYVQILMIYSFEIPVIDIIFKM